MLVPGLRDASGVLVRTILARADEVRSAVEAGLVLASDRLPAALRRAAVLVLLDVGDVHAPLACLGPRRFWETPFPALGRPEVDNMVR